MWPAAPKGPNEIVQDKRPWLDFPKKFRLKWRDLNHQPIALPRIGYLRLLKVDGNLTLVGAPEKPHAISAFALIMGRRSLSGSLIGGIAETQEMLDFCSQHNITADVEVTAIQKVNEAYARMLKCDVKYRFSIDMASLKTQ